MNETKVILKILRCELCNRRSVYVSKSGKRRCWKCKKQLKGVGELKDE